MHLTGTEIPAELEIDATKLGAWKHESTFIRARFLRQKSYVEETLNKNSFFLPELNLYGNTNFNITCAGMPERCYEHVTWDNFRSGSVYSGKLGMQHVHGGIVLNDIPFTIKKGA